MAQCKMCKYLKQSKEHNIYYCENNKDTSQEKCDLFSVSSTEYNRYKRIMLEIFRDKQNEYLRKLEDLGGNK